MYPDINPTPSPQDWPEPADSGNVTPYPADVFTTRVRLCVTLPRRTIREQPASISTITSYCSVAHDVRGHTERHAADRFDGIEKQSVRGNNRTSRHRETRTTLRRRTEPAHHLAAMAVGVKTEYRTPRKWCSRTRTTKQATVGVSPTNADRRESVGPEPSPQTGTGNRTPRRQSRTRQRPVQARIKPA